ncbi:hypothetical protein FRB93_004376 [Tulasnella sp. JGI-2019a]|nr:hypothetical protein FRB93_004376 [Tulasnella sp. JGI-2019a]
MRTNKCDRQLWTQPHWQAATGRDEFSGAVLVSYVTSKILAPVVLRDTVTPAIRTVEHANPWLAGVSCFHRRKLTDVSTNRYRLTVGRPLLAISSSTPTTMSSSACSINHQIVSFSPIEPLDMGEPGVITTPGVFINPMALQLATQAMVDVMEYVNTGLKSETTEVKVGRKTRTIERLCFPRQVIENMFTDMGERTLLQTSLERLLRKGSAGPFFRRLTVDMPLKKSTHDDFDPLYGTRISSCTNRAHSIPRMSMSMNTEMKLTWRSMRKLRSRLRVGSRMQLRPLRPRMRSRQPTPRKLTKARRGKKRARDDELEDDSEGVASGSGLICDPRQPTPENGSEDELSNRALTDISPLPACVAPASRCHRQAATTRPRALT